MTENVKLGRIIADEAHRDAIHVAVAPVVAAEMLQPGWHVRLDETGQAFLGGDTVGIVDPFLRQYVNKGQTFWLLLYPNTVTSLRHEWTHPAFQAVVERQTQRSDAERWLRAFATRSNSYDDVETAFARLVEGLKTGHIVTHGTEIWNASDIEDRDELQRQAEAYLGRPVKLGDYRFSCSC